MFDLNSFRLGIMMATAIIVFSKHVPKKKKKEKKPDPQPNPNFIPTLCRKQTRYDPIYLDSNSVYKNHYDHITYDSNVKNVGYVMTQYLTDVCDKTQSFHLTGRVKTKGENVVLNVRSQPCTDGKIIRILGNNVEVDIIEYGTLWSKIDLTRYQNNDDKERYKSAAKIFQNAMTAKDATSTYKYYEVLNKSFNRMEESI